MRVRDDEGYKLGATGNLGSCDRDTTETVTLAVNTTDIGSVAATSVSYTVAGLESEDGADTAVVTFTDGTNHVTATVTANGTYTVDLHTLTDGSITSSMAVSDSAGNHFSATGTTATLDRAPPHTAPLPLTTTA